MESIKREVRKEKEYRGPKPGGACAQRTSTEAPMVLHVQGCDSDTRMERNSSLCLVLNKVWLRCSDVSEDGLAQDIMGNSQQAAGTTAFLG